jgi:hypothetical protein
MSRADQVSSRRGGDNAEAAVLQEIPELRYVSDSEARGYDAEVAEPLLPSPSLPFVGVCVLETGAPVEIKSAMVVNCEDQARGRFFLRQKQHRRLVTLAGFYCFAVCRPTPSRDVLAMKVVPATTVDAAISSWIDVQDDSRAESAYAQLSWSRIFDVEEVDR